MKQINVFIEMVISVAVDCKSIVKLIADKGKPTSLSIPRDENLRQ